MAKCWEKRGCDEEMQAECPHPTAIGDRCPAKCAFAICDRPTFEVSTDPDVIFAADVDRDQAIKDVCLYCSFFLANCKKS